MANAYSTYSFQDAILTLYDGAGRSLSTSGEGTGDITIGYSADRSAISVANDGHAVISKIKDESGTLELQCLQSSPLHRNLLKWFNRLVAGDTSEWASMTGHFQNRSTGMQKDLIGVAFTKIPDDANGKEAQMVSWSFVVAKIVSEVI